MAGSQGEGRAAAATSDHGVVEAAPSTTTPDVAPDAEEVAYYAGLLKAMHEAEAAGSGAVTYRGQMVDYAMLPIAEEVLREARRFGVPVPA